MAEAEPTDAPGDPGGADAAGERERRPGGRRALLELVAMLVAAVAAALLVRAFVVQTFWIPSKSMEDTLAVRDRVLVDKVSLRFRDAHRGDIVVFRRPEGVGGDPGIDDLIKRVVALPGETVEFADGRVVVDGRPLDEPYLEPGTQTQGDGRVVVPVGRLWVMGDNRSNSLDSRVFGPVDEDAVVGRAFVRIWPPSALGAL